MFSLAAISTDFSFPTAIKFPASYAHRLVGQKSSLMQAQIWSIPCGGQGNLGEGAEAGKSFKKYILPLYIFIYHLCSLMMFSVQFNFG